MNVDVTVAPRGGGRLIVWTLPSGTIASDPHGVRPRFFLETEALTPELYSLVDVDHYLDDAGFASESDEALALLLAYATHQLLAAVDL